MALPNPKPIAVLPRNAEFALEVLVALAGVRDVADATAETVLPGADVLPVTDACNEVEVGADVDGPAWGVVPSSAGSSATAVSVVIATAPLEVTVQTAVFAANPHSSFNVIVSSGNV
jgi:hypothetical protein